MAQLGALRLVKVGLKLLGLVMFGLLVDVGGWIGVMRLVLVVINEYELWQTISHDCCDQSP